MAARDIYLRIETIVGYSPIEPDEGTGDLQQRSGRAVHSAAFTTRLEAAGIAISMDGRGRWLDNVFVERLWRSLKYEEVHLKAYADGRAARAGIGSWVAFYNDRRPHQALAYRTPMAVWRGGREPAVDMIPGTLAGGWTTPERCPHAHSRHRNNK